MKFNKYDIGGWIISRKVRKFISIDNKQFVNKTVSVETESNVEVDPIRFFVDSTTYKRMWVSKT